MEVIVNKKSDLSRWNSCSSDTSLTINVNQLDWTMEQLFGLFLLP
jgi:hypothetical protein